MNSNARRAHEAHRRRTSGERWESIAEDLGYGSARSARSAVRRYAKKLGWDWPIESPRHGGIPVAGYSNHPEAAYELRLQGLKWQEVGARIGLHSPTAHAIAIKYARKHAQRHGLGWPPKIIAEVAAPDGGEEAYRLRGERLSWQEVGKRTGLGSRAPRRAQRYAKINGKPWPIETVSMGERAYQIKHENPDMSWKLVAKKAGYTHSHHAGTAARRIAIAKCGEWMQEFAAGYHDPNTLANEAWEAVGLHSDTISTTPEQVLRMAQNVIKG